MVSFRKRRCRSQSTTCQLAMSKKLILQIITPSLAKSR